jgi:hypothetical protein
VLANRPKDRGYQGEEHWWDFCRGLWTKVTRHNLQDFALGISQGVKGKTIVHHLFITVVMISFLNAMTGGQKGRQKLMALRLGKGGCEMQN